LAKERLEASEALRKSVFSDKGQRGFQKSHPQKNPGHGGGSQYNSGQAGVKKGWQASGNKARKGQPNK